MYAQNYCQFSFMERYLFRNYNLIYMNKVENSMQRAASRGSSRAIGSWYNMKNSTPSYGSSIKKNTNIPDPKNLRSSQKPASYNY